MPHPPVVYGLAKSLTVGLDAIREGLPFLQGCVVINPDGTGFGSGTLDFQLTRLSRGDEIRLRPDAELSIRSDQVYHRNHLVARCLPSEDTGRPPTRLAIKLQPHTYFDTVAAILGKIVLMNGDPCPGERKIFAKITDADADCTTVEVAIGVGCDLDDELVARFASLPPVKQRGALATMIRSLLPPSFIPRYRPPGVDLTRGREYRNYAAFELDALWNAQSLGFMVELLPMMYPYLATFEGKKQSIQCLDVGSRTGAGGALVSDLFQSYFAVLRIEVDTIDIDKSFQAYQIARWPHIRQAIIGDIFEIGDHTYDIVICSHTIEHLADPVAFARKLSRIARHYAFFYCPYAEDDPIPGHRRVDDTLLERLQPLERRVLPSWWWRTPKQQGMQDCVFFVLQGAAEC